MVYHQLDIFHPQVFIINEQRQFYIIQLLRSNKFYQTKDQNVPDTSTSGSAIVIISGSIEDLGRIDIAS